jgi:hypothetical protein
MTNVAQIADFQPPKTLGTPEGRIALHGVASNPAWGETDLREARRWLKPAVVDALPAALREADSRLAAATLAHAKRFLGPALALVAPTTMSSDHREEWLIAALDTLSGIPPDLLEEGCRKARQKVRFPSEIVPTIFEEVGGVWDIRRRDLQFVKRMARAADIASEGIDQAEPYCTPEEARVILSEFGFGSITPSVAKAHHGQPRAPTAEDIAEIMKEMGKA